jgi:hypothetical protein
MMFITPITAAAVVLAAVVSTVPVVEKSATGDFALTIPGGNFNINYLQALDVYCADDGAYLGEIRYQLYSEPLIVSGAGVSAGSGSGLTFESIHSTANGGQEAYFVPKQTKPIGFSAPHGTPPAGVRISSFAFNGSGTLTNNGLNSFYACQMRNRLPSIPTRYGGGVLGSRTRCLARDLFISRKPTRQYYFESTCTRSHTMIASRTLHEWDADRGELENAFSVAGSSSSLSCC